MEDDTGFAPNPFHGLLTLATCKAGIRNTKGPGSYVAGFTSKALCGDKVGEERLIFIMKITEKMSFDDYYNDPRYQCKKPTKENRITKAGDNIYFKNGNAYKRGIAFRHLNKEMFDSDHKSDKVLISSEFFYFGKGAIPVDQFKINIPKTVAPYGYETADEEIISDLWNYLTKNYKKNTVIHYPHDFEKESDCSQFPSKN
jgi:hypothetical protein